MQLETARLEIRSARKTDAADLRSYYIRNQAHLRPFEPRRPDGYHSQEAWQTRATDMERSFADGSAVTFVARQRNDGPIVAVCSFSNITRGAFQACNLGYSVCAAQQGKGFMSEVLVAAIGYVFGELDLHRIMANHLPENERSARLLARLGFEREGFARSYLKIDGRWRDHVLTSLLNPSH